MKSQEEIVARRALKRRFVTMAQQCAVAGARAVSGNRKLNDSETGNVTVIARDFYVSLAPADMTVLRAAKGCNSRPPKSTYREYLALTDFLKIPTLSVQQAGCMGTFTHDLVQWAHQVMAKNPRSFSVQDKAQFNAAVAQAQRDVVVPIDTYRLNPAQYGEPGDAEEALYWCLMELAKIMADYDDAAHRLTHKAAIRSAWKKAVDATVSKELRDNPNIETLRGDAFHARAETRAIKEYGAYLMIG